MSVPVSLVKTNDIKQLIFRLDKDKNSYHLVSGH